MAKKEKFQGQAVVCDKCGQKAIGIPGHHHRRCGGGEDQPPREKRANRLAHQARGIWR